MHPVRLVCVAAVTAVCTPMLLTGQGRRAVATASLPEAVVTSVRESVRTPRYSFDLRDVPLAQAIREIANVSGASIWFSDQLLPANTRVTYRADQATVEQALGAVLRGTSIGFRQTGVNEITLGRAARVADGIILGKVVNAKTKQPVAGVTVTLGDATQGVVTASDGTFRLPASVGSHTVRIRAVGFVRQAKQVTVTDGQTAMVEFSAEPSASVLDEVIVTGTVVETQRRELTTPITVITAEDLEKRNITRIEQLFRGEVPGVVALELGTSSLSNGLGRAQTATVFSRGSSGLGNRTPTPLKTYIDGVELLDPSYLGTIDPRGIERIEIIAGPQAATIYGSGAMGGVMQIFTKKGSRSGRPEMTLNLRYGLLQSSLNSSYTPTHNHTLSANGGNGADFNYSATGSYAYQGQWQPGLWQRNTGLTAGMTHQRGKVQVGASASVFGTQNGMFGVSNSSGVCNAFNQVCYSSLVIRTLREQGELPPDAGVAGFFESNLSKSFSQSTSIDINVRPWSVWQNTLTLGRVYNQFATEPQRPRFVTPTDTLYLKRWQNGARLTANYSTTLVPRIGPIATTLTLGGSFTQATEDSYLGCMGSFNGTSYVACSQYSSPGVTSTPTNRDKNWGGFGQLQFGFFDRLYVKLGVRGERNPTYGSDHPVDWTPTQGIAYTIEAGELTLKLLASYGTATRTPAADARLPQYQSDPGQTPASILYQFGNPSLGPERSRGPQGGFELYYGNRGSFSLNRYDQRVVDLLMNVRVDSAEILYSWSTTWSWIPQTQWQNVGVVRQHGWEAQGSLNLGPLTFKGTYTLADARTLKVNPQGRIAGGLSVIAVGQTRQGIPDHYGSLNIGYAHGPMSVTWTGNYVGASNQGSGSTYWNVVENMLRLQMYRQSMYGWYYPVSTPGYLKQNLAATQRLSSRASLMLNVQNLSDRHDSELTVFHPSLGRQTQLGLSYRFL